MLVFMIFYREGWKIMVLLEILGPLQICPIGFLKAIALSKSTPKRQTDLDRPTLSHLHLGKGRRHLEISLLPLTVLVPVQ